MIIIGSVQYKSYSKFPTLGELSIGLGLHIGLGLAVGIKDRINTVRFG